MEAYKTSMILEMAKL